LELGANAVAQPSHQEVKSMLIKAKITLTVAIILCTIFSAAAATSKHHRTVHARSPIYNAGPNNVSVSTQCLPTDSPCRTRPDDW
jgi:hypothetical protein